MRPAEAPDGPWGRPAQYRPERRLGVATGVDAIILGTVTVSRNFVVFDRNGRSDVKIGTLASAALVRSTKPFSDGTKPYRARHEGGRKRTSARMAEPMNSGVRSCQYSLPSSIARFAKPV